MIYTPPPQYILIFLIFNMVLLSCGQKLSPEEEMIRETLDKTVNINLFDSIRKGGESFHFTEFREKLKSKQGKSRSAHQGDS